MIVEHAPLDVKPGLEPEFERAFDQAKVIIASMPGFIDLSLARCVERPSSYLLLVHWNRIEDHAAFRRSEGYEDWRGLLHHFYDPFPTVEHYENIASA